jgi:predicted RecA/RadA family phage recombinase
MKNFVQPGDVISVPAPANVSAGGGVVVGSLFGVAVATALSGQPVEIAVTGVFDLPKTAAQAWTVGQLLYWSGTAVTSVASTNRLIGVAAAPALSADTVGRVRLNGAGITA